MLLEAFGAMLLTFLYLTQTEEKTKLSSDPTITTMIISATYTCVTTFSIASGVTSGSPFNPAIAFGEFWAILFGGDFSDGSRSNLWVAFFFSFAGSLAAVFLFEFVYKKAIASIQESGQHSDTDNDEQQLLGHA